MANNYTYKDIDLNFLIHPVKKDINTLIDADAIIAAVKNLVLTNFYETPFNPQLGSNLTALLFENWSPALDALVAQQVSQVIQIYEPRVDLTEIDVTFNDDGDGQYQVTIKFVIKTIPNKVFEGSFFIDKAR